MIVIGISFCIGVPDFVQIATILNFMISVFWPCSHQIWRKYLHRRPKQGQRPKSKMAAAAVLNFTKSVIVGKSDGRMTNTSTAILNFQRPGNPRMGSICVCRRNLVQIGQELAEIYLFVYFQDAAAAILNFTESWILTHSTPWPMSVSYTHLTLPTNREV